MRSSLCAVVFALSGCGTVSLPEPAPQLDPPPAQTMCDRVGYTESFSDVLLLEDLYFRFQRLAYLIDRYNGYRSIELGQGATDLYQWSRHLAYRIGERLEHTAVEDSGWRVSSQILDDITQRATQSISVSSHIGLENFQSELQRIARIASEYHESRTDHGWLVGPDSLLPLLFLETGIWSEN